MPVYDVTLSMSGYCSWTGSVRVEAEDETEAHNKAYNTPKHKIDWKYDDNPQEDGDVDVADVELIEDDEESPDVVSGG